MSRMKKTSASKKTRTPAARAPGQKVSLKFLADYLGLSPATLSLVMNRSAVADSIPKATQDQIFAAAEKFNYRPNFMARSLRTQRSFTIGVIVPEISEGYETLVLSGIEEHLLREGYFYFVASHHHRPDLIDEYPRLLLDRSVEGLIAVDTPWHHDLSIPVVTVSGHNEVDKVPNPATAIVTNIVTNIVLDHRRAAELALEHLFKLGHRRIAFIKGQEFSSDTEARWDAIVQAAAQFGLAIYPKLTTQLQGEIPSPDLGYRVTRRLLAKHEPFSAIFAFNDISAIGAIRALREKGLRVPEDVSVVGFDDIQSAAYQNPGLTTVRQPLSKMGKIAAETVLRRIGRNGQEHNADHPKQITVEPELVVRESTCKASQPDGAKSRAAENVLDR